MSNKTCIRFLTNEANKVEGLAYAGFETFRGSPYTSCARETGQNSRDAAAGCGSVRVSFDLVELNREDIPFADPLEHSIDCCLIAPQDAKTNSFLERARKKISASTIRVLRITDENTTGLTGPIEDARSVFAALVKGDGVTNKADPTSAGSYGIGKNAAYAVSDLQMVIYSTRYLEVPSGTVKFAAQGRLRLISHADGIKKLSAEGYWGKADFQAIEDESDAPDWVLRETIGTSIFALGFREQDKWVDRMSLALATNFFVAIDRKDIEFSLNAGKVEINQASIDSVLDSEALAQAAKENDQNLDLERARRLMQCLRSDATERHMISVPSLGDFTLHLLVAEGQPREVHVIRNGIYICDNFAKFGQPMKRFPGTREFIAVLEPSEGESGKKPSQLLKQLENPAHDAFEPERIVDPQEISKAKSQIKSLITQVRDIIKSSAKIDDIDRAQLDELSQFFAEGGNGATQDDPEAEKDPERFRYGSARKSKPVQPPSAGGSGVASGGRGLNGEPGKGQQRKKAKRHGIQKGGSQSKVFLSEVRSVLPDKTDARVRTIFFTPAENGNVEVAVAAAGLADDVELRLEGASVGTIAKGRLRIPVAAGQRTHVDVKFADSYEGPIELWANVLKDNVEEDA